MDEYRAKSAGLLRLALGCLLASVSIGCSLQQAHTCCPIYPPSHYRLTKEAVRVPPCGPDGLYHGFKKTVWKTWPDGWDEFAPTNCPEDNPIEVIETPDADAAADAADAEADEEAPDQPGELPALEPIPNDPEEGDRLLAPEPLDTLDLPPDGALQGVGESRVVRASFEEQLDDEAESMRRLPPVSD